MVPEVVVVAAATVFLTFLIWLGHVFPPDD